jgi:hypothetical protein
VRKGNRKHKRESDILFDAVKRRMRMQTSYFFFFFGDTVPYKHTVAKRAIP